MADSTPLLVQMAAAADNREIVFNGDVDALSPSGLYGRNYLTCTGLVFGYFGGYFNGVEVPNGTVTATASNTNYVVAHRTTGVVSISTATTNRDNTTTYLYLYELVAGVSSITSYKDKRQALGASLTGGGAGTASTLDFDTDGTLAANSDAKVATQKATKTYADTKQPLDSDLTTIAGLTATTDNFMQSKSSAWASRTVAQVSADLQATGLITDAVGYRTVPSNSQSTAYTTVAADSGKGIDHPSTDANARTFTIDSNANVAYPVGTCITFTNMTANVVTIAITSDTLYLAGTGTTGSRSLAQYGMATARKLTSTTWLIAGTGLT